MPGLQVLGLGVTALIAVVLQAGLAHAREDRTISFFHIHTKETITVLYKRNGSYIPDAMKKIDWIMRDWRRDESIKMDPKTIDIIWEMHRELGSQKPVSIISGYRSPATNTMLRKTRGGQAQRSHHMTGKAIDISFPDVPIRRMRYSAMIRERGGVGYYPTSGIPFVHVDSARVRHWPRMVRDELALLFPSGRTQHRPADGKPITRGDATAARAKRKDLAQEVAQYFAIRDGKVQPAPVQVAEAWQASVASAPVPMPARAVRPTPAPDRRMAAGAPVPPRDATRPEAMTSLASLSVDTPSSRPSAPKPKLVAAPRPIDRPSEFVNRLPDAERSRLDMLVKLASLEEPSSLPAETGTSSLITGTAPLRTASLTPSWPSLRKAAPVTEDLASGADLAHNPLSAGSSDWRSGWHVAPAYDDDHPDELAYRPFALGPLLTETPSFDDPALVTLVHPDANEALAMLDDEGSALPMRFGPETSHTAMAWAQAFSGDAVNFDAFATASEPSAPSGPQLLARAVKTQPR
ncbi:hypothetical protein W911_15305 [Hyphomicrobium nitrativorans NL23]|uniref:Murein endopeptidase K n=1 Tax=Hyphomicrobium nitrativorans NL23 TaxID=1029756 RepID=V5SHN5_9HYPH|nr:DUF882 domain-containing protein [Hyphomicrobium nitrativorans]AHB49454.1 hypothetical protein W911_15305 [Hyphomicrobium nitrativorans NL23]